MKKKKIVRYSIQTIEMHFIMMFVFFGFIMPYHLTMVKHTYFIINYLDFFLLSLGQTLPI